MAYAIDTAAAIRNLEGAGLDGKAARAIVETMAQADQDTATKADIATLKAELKADLTVRMIGSQIAVAALLFAALRYVGG